MCPFLCIYNGSLFRYLTVLLTPPPPKKIIFPLYADINHHLLLIHSFCTGLPFLSFLFKGFFPFSSYL
jgi:hypothetical protein